MKALEYFKENIKSAKHLINLYEFLHSDRQRSLRIERKERLAKIFRKPTNGIKDIADNKSLIILILNQPTSPDRKFFKKTELKFLLRQALVAGCSALDCFFQELYKENCYKVYSLIEKRISNLRHNKKRKTVNEEKINKLKRSKIFKQPITMRHYLAISQYGGSRKGHAIKEAILSSKAGKSVQCPKDVSDLFKGIDLNFWKTVASAINKRESDLTRRLEKIVKRRNQIIHSGDRPIRNRRIARNPESIESDWVIGEIEFMGKIATIAKNCVGKHANQIPKYLLEQK